MNHQVVNDNNTSTKMILEQHATKFTGREKLMLPENYKPTDDVVIIGRGKKIREHIGNQRFYAMIDSNLDAYQRAATKGLKSSILWNILTQVRKNSHNGFGFVKREGGRWCVIEDGCARINIAQAFRDRLSFSYKSSKQQKSIKRKHDLGILPKEMPVGDNLMREGIMACLVKCDLQREQPAKRVCREYVAAKDVLAYPSYPFSAESCASMDTIRGILHSASQVLQESQAEPTINVCNPQEDIFSSLWNKFGSADVTENPFEPKPIEMVQDHQVEPLKHSSSFFMTKKRPDMTASSCIFDRQPAEPISLASTSNCGRRFSMASLGSVEWTREETNAFLDDSFEKVNDMWTNDSFLMSN